ncbi:MAG: TrkH family potassium uptake protein [Nitrospirae bacterium]|nr:TrkH family potassium uptake protein [Nitrospirota bacterium]
MNIPLVLNLVGIVIIIASTFMLLPVAVSIIYGGEDFTALGESFLIALFAGIILSFLTRAQRGTEIKHRDGFAVVTLSWLAISFFGSLPFILSGSIPSFTDAYFEAMSGFTTTGASILTDVEALPKGILLWRSLTHWMAGMGIIVLSLAILPMLGAGGMQLFKAEVSEIVVERLRPRIADTAKSLWYVYTAITIFGVILLLLGGMDLYDALCHSFGAVATGGFSIKNASIAYYQSAYIDIVITILMLIGGVNFSLHFYAFRGDFSRYWRSSEFRFFCLIVFSSIVLITLNIIGSNYRSLFDALRYASFQVASIVTATGYVTADFEKWPVLSQMLLVSLMFFGGMVGSTAGGMKQVRILLMLKQAYRELYQLIHPHAVTYIKLDGKPLTKEILGGIWGFLFLFLFIWVIATVSMTALGIDIITAATTTISAMSNVGPALGTAGPAENYSTIPTLGKWILILCMLIGRLEIYTVIVLFVPHFWRK